MLQIYRDSSSFEFAALRLLLQAKEIEHSCDDVDVCPIQSQSNIVLINRDLVIDKFDTIIDYVEDRYPFPNFLPDTPDEKAQTRLAIKDVLSQLYPTARESFTEAYDQIQALRPDRAFITSNRPTMIDLLVYPLIVNNDDWSPYRQRLQKALL